MGLRIMCAGCSKEEREQAEVAVKRALHARPRVRGVDGVPREDARAMVGHPRRPCRRRPLPDDAGPREPPGRVDHGGVAQRPGLARPRAPGAHRPTPHSGARAPRRHRPLAGSRARPPGRLTSPRRPRSPARPARPSSRRSPPAARPSAPPAGSTDRLQCEKCGRPFRVVYESQPGEEMEVAPVACPHCWHGNRAMVGAEAAETRDYRAEKLDS